MKTSVTLSQRLEKRVDDHFHSISQECGFQVASAACTVGAESGVRGGTDLGHPECLPPFLAGGLQLGYLLFTPLEPPFSHLESGENNPFLQN